MKRARVAAFHLKRIFMESSFEIPLALAVLALGFLVLASGGVNAPGSVERSTPMWLALTWSLGLLLGGLGTIVGKVINKERIEQSGLAFMAYGNAFYSLVLFTQGNMPSAITPATIMAAIAIGCLIRVRVITKSRDTVNSVKREGSR